MNDAGEAAFGMERLTFLPKPGGTAGLLRPFEHPHRAPTHEPVSIKPEKRLRPYLESAGRRASLSVVWLRSMRGLLLA
jgi:hypothetical protein